MLDVQIETVSFWIPSFLTENGMSDVEYKVGDKVIYNYREQEVTEVKNGNAMAVSTGVSTTSTGGNGFNVRPSTPENRQIATTVKSYYSLLSDKYNGFINFPGINSYMNRMCNRIIDGNEDINTVKAFTNEVIKRCDDLGTVQGVPVMRGF